MIFLNPERQFYFRLARELGKTVDEMLNQMSAKEIIEWQVFLEIEANERKNKDTQQQMLDNLANRNKVRRIR